MATSKRDENSRRYKLKMERALIKLTEIQSDYLPTGPAAELWKLTRDQALALLDKLPGELQRAVKDHRSSPGEAQSVLQATVYLVLTEIASPALVDKAVKQFKRGRS